MVTWICALYFYFSTVTNWQLPAAQSRVKNMECLVLGELKPFVSSENMKFKPTAAINILIQFFTISSFSKNLVLQYWYAILFTVSIFNPFIIDVLLYIRVTMVLNACSNARKYFKF